MKRLHFNTLLLVLLSTWVGEIRGQAQNYTLSSNESGSTKTYVARDSIYLKPGFSYLATSGKTFSAKIDAGLLFPPSVGTYLKPDGNTTSIASEGVAVGSIPGQFSVSPSGSATYSIPIECPPGINGLQPSLALVYNSQGGNGIAGWGWNLSAGSAITRTGSSIYHDNSIATIRWDTLDNIVLDGQRLICVSGSRFTIGSKYRTESESFNDITYKIISVH